MILMILPQAFKCLSSITGSRGLTVASAAGADCLEEFNTRVQERLGPKVFSRMGTSFPVQCHAMKSWSKFGKAQITKSIQKQSKAKLGTVRNCSIIMYYHVLSFPNEIAVFFVEPSWPNTTFQVPGGSVVARSFPVPEVWNICGLGQQSAIHWALHRSGAKGLGSDGSDGWFWSIRLDFARNFAMGFLAKIYERLQR